MMIPATVQMEAMSLVRQRRLSIGIIECNLASGTGACPDTYFYCQNKGHIGALIPSSRVRDELCGTPSWSM